MKRMKHRMAAVGAAAAAFLAFAATPASAVTQLCQGHVDVLDVDWTGSALTLDLLDYVPNPDVQHDPANVELIVKPAAQFTVPSGSQWAFLGSPGSTVWVLPQSETDATSRGVLWPGWNSNGAASGVSGLTIHMVSVGGSNPGDVSIYTVGMFGNVTKLFDSGDGLPDTKSLGLNAHEHANWAFEGAGTYTVTFKVTANGGLTTGNKTYKFIVNQSC